MAALEKNRFEVVLPSLWFLSAHVFHFCIFIYKNHFFFFVLVDFDFWEDEEAFLGDDEDFFDDEEEDLLGDPILDLLELEGVYDFIAFLLDEEPLYDSFVPINLSDWLLSFDM